MGGPGLAVRGADVSKRNQNIFGKKYSTSTYEKLIVVHSVGFKNGDQHNVCVLYLICE